MRYIRKHTGVIIIILIIVTLLLTALVLWMQTKYSRDCGDDTQCFYQAYTSGCSPSAITTTHTTIEGDPIIHTAALQPKNTECEIAITIDTSKDTFIGQASKIQTYTCTELTMNSSQELTASQCSGDIESLKI